MEPSLGAPDGHIGTVPGSAAKNETAAIYPIIMIGYSVCYLGLLSEEYSIDIGEIAAVLLFKKRRVLNQAERVIVQTFSYRPLPIMNRVSRRLPVWIEPIRQHMRITLRVVHLEISIAYCQRQVF